MGDMHMLPDLLLPHCPRGVIACLWCILFDCVNRICQACLGHIALFFGVSPMRSHEPAICIWSHEGLCPRRFFPSLPARCPLALKLGRTFTVHCLISTANGSSCSMISRFSVIEC